MALLQLCLPLFKRQVSELQNDLILTRGTRCWKIKSNGFSFLRTFAEIKWKLIAN